MSDSHHLRGDLRPARLRDRLAVSRMRLDDRLEAHDSLSADITKLNLEGAERLALAGMAISLQNARLRAFEVNGPRLNQAGLGPLDLVRSIVERGSFKQISFVDEQQNQTYASNSNEFQQVFTNREILGVLGTKYEICRPSAINASICPGAVVRSA